MIEIIKNIFTDPAIGSIVNPIVGFIVIATYWYLIIYYIRAERKKLKSISNEEVF